MLIAKEIFLLTHPKISTHAVFLTLAKILWTTSTTPLTPKFYPMSPTKPHNPRYLADSKILQSDRESSVNVKKTGNSNVF